MEGVLWSETAASVMACLGPNPGATVTYPPSRPSLVGFRAARDASGMEVFRQILDGAEPVIPMNDVHGYELSDSVFFVGYATWTTAGKLAAFSFQAFVAQGAPILAFALDSDVPEKAHIIYLRCDYHPQEAGKFGAEAPIHVHVRSRGAPRFGMPTGGNPLMAFLEFIAVSFEHEIWLAWAKDVATWRGARDSFQDVTSAYDEGRVYTEWEVQGETTRGLMGHLAFVKQTLGQWEFDLVDPGLATYQLG